MPTYNHIPDTGKKVRAPDEESHDCPECGEGLSVNCLGHEAYSYCTNCSWSDYHDALGKYTKWSNIERQRLE